MKPARVMFIRSTSIYGGLERLIVGFARRLDPETFESVVVTFGDNVCEAGSFLRAASNNGLRTAVLDACGGFDPRGARRLVHLARDMKIDLLCPQDYRANFYALAAGRRLGIPVAATVHGYTYHTPKVRLYELWDRLTLRRADAVICVSEKLRSQLCRWGVPKHKLHTVHNSIDMKNKFSSLGAMRHAELGSASAPPNWTLNRVQGDMPLHVELNSFDVNEIDPAPGFPASDFLVCSIGRLSIEKGHRYLIDAWPSVLFRVPSARLVLVGDGPERPRLTAQALNLGVGPSVEFTGFIDSPMEHLRACDVFVLPSLTEGVPVALLEACAARKPIVATDVGGIGEVVTSGHSAKLVRPRRPRELADAIVWALEHRGEANALADRAGEIVEHKFSYDVNVPLLEDVYRSCLGISSVLSTAACHPELDSGSTLGGADAESSSA